MPPKPKSPIAKLPESFDTGGIVGVAEIKDCVKRHRSKWFQGPYGWTLANARRFPFKPIKGHLKFFTPDIRLNRAASPPVQHSKY